MCFPRCPRSFFGGTMTASGDYERIRTREGLVGYVKDRFGIDLRRTHQHRGEASHRHGIERRRLAGHTFRFSTSGSCWVHVSDTLPASTTTQPSSLIGNRIRSRPPLFDTLGHLFTIRQATTTSRSGSHGPRQDFGGPPRTYRRSHRMI